MNTMIHNFSNMITRKTTKRTRRRWAWCGLSLGGFIM